MIDFEFSSAHALGAGANAVLSEQIENKGSSFIAHPGDGEEEYIFYSITAKAGSDTPSVVIDYVGADDEAISSNVIVIGTTGTIADPTVAPPYVGKILIQRQASAKQYYAVRFTKTGTNPNFTVNAYRGKAGTPRI